MSDVLRRAYEALDAADETLSRPRPAAGTEWRLPEPEPVRRSEVPPLTRGHVLDAINAGLAGERRGMRAHLERRLTQTVEMLAEETAALVKDLRTAYERRLGVLQTAHEADMRALREELAAARQPERKRLPAPRHNGRAAVQ